MSEQAFANLQEIILQVLGPWAVLFFAGLITGAVLLAALFPFLTLLRMMTRRKQ